MKNVHRTADPPLDEALWHRFGVVIAEVTATTNTKADRRIGRARETAVDLRRLAAKLRVRMEESRDAGAMTGPAAARELHSSRELVRVSRAFAAVYTPWLEEHRALVEQDVQQTIEKFLSWFPERMNALKERVRSFEQQVAADLRADAEPLLRYGV